MTIHNKVFKPHWSFDLSSIPGKSDRCCGVWTIIYGDRWGIVRLFRVCLITFRVDVWGIGQIHTLAGHRSLLDQVALVEVLVEVALVPGPVGFQAS